MTQIETSSETQGSEVDDLLQKKEFGVSLKIARETQGLSISDVAGKLLIAEDIIRAIENSQADALPAATFTQGYIRSYARILNVSADEVIEAYSQVVPDARQPLTPHSVLPVQKTSGDLLVKIFSFGFVLVGIVVLLVWLYQTDFSLQDSGFIDKIEKESTFRKDALFDMGKDNASEVDGFSEKDVSLPDKVVPNEAPVKLVQKDQTSTAQVSESQLVKKAEKETQKNTEKTLDQLLLTALDNSWCEINDATGKRLYYQLINKDEDVRLNGQAPFQVFLGNGPKVRIELNSQIVSFDHLINDGSNIANISIQENAEAIRATARN